MTLSVAGTYITYILFDEFIKNRMISAHSNQPTYYIYVR